MAESSQIIPHTNRLARESSPYLLQHAHNPVDWYPWGPEAFEAARKKNMPIFLSVGYSTCYWCHVMERQSFENDAVAAEMNQRFINIKVDREERPDVDQLYMSAVQVLTRHGGWPMSVFMTPELRPFYGGTYYPPADMHGRPGFVSILRGIEDAYQNRPADIAKTTRQLEDILRQMAQPVSPQSPMVVDDAFVQSLIERSTSDYEPRFGGFGGAPKFPRETLLELLLVYLQSPAIAPALKTKLEKMLRHTLDAMADGGIRDQLGGGFHRYSTDARWLVPHFEIMLYDNAMLAWCYVEASAQLHEPRYAQVARGIFEFILREMTAGDGGLYTAMDAEVDSQEGLNYLWTAAEIESLLGADDARLFNQVYGVDQGPNFADPHHSAGAPDQNILFFPRPLAQAAAALKTTPEELESRLAPMRQTLYAARQKRKQPILDTKIITSWNALMIRALAHGGKTLAEPRYTAAAARAADFLLRAHRLPDNGLLRTSRDGSGKYRGFIDDYAFLTQALLALHEATGEPRWKQQAGELATVMIEKFADRESGGFFFTEKDATDLIIRQKTASDSPLPSGNAIAALALLELGQVAEARAAIALFSAQLESQGEGMSAMVQAALIHTRRAGPFTVSAAEGDATNRALSPTQVAESVVAVRAQWGSDLELQVHLTIQDGFHLNAHDVPPGMSLIPTALTLADDAGAAEIVYPPGETLHVDFADKPLNVYSGQVTITVRFRAAPPSGHAVSLNLTYQACDETACLLPVTKRLILD